MGAVFLYPLSAALDLSIHEKSYGAGNIFVGLDNYRKLLEDSYYLKSIYLTIKYMVYSVPTAYFIGLACALALNKPFRGRTFARAVMVIPWVIPNFVIALIWYWFFNYELGFFNLVLSRLLGMKIVWLGPELAFLSITLVTIWKWTPFFSIMLLAGLQSIPPTLYEAAAIDGASSWLKFKHITLPSLKPVTMIIIFLQSLMCFRMFTFPYVIAGGGPAHLTELIAVRIFIETQMGAFNYPSAMAIFVAPFLGIATVILAKIMMKGE